MNVLITKDAKVRCGGVSLRDGYFEGAGLEHTGADTSADGAATLTEGEAGARLKGDGVDELTDHLNVVTRMNELLVSILGAFREMKSAGDVSGTDEELGAVVVHERSVCAGITVSAGRLGMESSEWLTATALVLGKNVDGGKELLDRLDGAGSSNDHTTLDLVTADTTEESTHVVTGLTALKVLVEHFNASEGGLERAAEAEDLDFAALGDDTTLDTTSNDGTTARDGEDVLNRHKERLLEFTEGLVNPAVDRGHEVKNGLGADAVNLLALDGSKSGALVDGSVVTVEAVAIAAETLSTQASRLAKMMTTHEESKSRISISTRSSISGSSTWSTLLMKMQSF